MGKCVARVNYMNAVYDLSFAVLSKEVQPILGLNACDKLNLVKRILSVESQYDKLWNTVAGIYGSVQWTWLLTRRTQLKYRNKSPQIYVGRYLLHCETSLKHFKLPTRNEIMAQFANAKYFSKLDASSGFWQLKLDEASSKLFTFNTPHERSRFLRLPFSIVSAPEVYHKTTHAIWAYWGCQYMYGSVLEATRRANLKLSKEKCVLGMT